LEPVNITSIKSASHGFDLTTESGERVPARLLVIAAGITHFAWLPEILSGLSREFVSHSSGYGDLSSLKSKRVAVLGAGASAVDIAAILHEMGAEPELITRTKEIAFHSPSQEPRPLLERITNPRSGLGLGWRSRLCTDAPLLFHKMPADLRVRIVRRHLGPAPGWFVKEKVVGRFPMHLGVELKEVSVKDSQLHLKFGQNGDTKELVVDHLIAGTGYRVSLSKLGFLDESLRSEIRVLECSPILSPSFESSVPGLYFVGVASANAFGPLTRFAYGARFTARRLSRHLACK
jgi:thioredoxin reductase